MAAVKLFRKYVSSYFTKPLGQALVLSPLDYCSGPAQPQGNLNKLQVAQNKAARITL